MIFFCIRYKVCIHCKSLSISPSFVEQISFFSQILLKAILNTMAS